MGDSLSAAVTFEYLRDEVINVVTSDAGQRHQWQWLTKRPQRMAEFSNFLMGRGIPWPENLWAGTSITTQNSTSRIDPLLRVGNDRTIRFLSVEPQWEAIDLSNWLPRLNWVIQGGQSGGNPVPFELDWARDLLRQCREARVPHFLKQLGAHALDGGKKLKLIDRHGGEWEEWPKSIRVREMPFGIPHAAVLPSSAKRPDRKRIALV